MGGLIVKDTTKKNVIDHINDITNPEQFIMFMDFGLKGLTTWEDVKELVELSVNTYHKNYPENQMTIQINSHWGKKYYDVYIMFAYITTDGELMTDSIYNTNRKISKINK